MIKTTYLFFAADGSPPEILEQHPEMKKSPQIVGVLPAELSSSFIRDCPPAQMKYLSKTLPYLVEDSIASPIDAMHCLSQQLKNSQPLRNSQPENSQIRVIATSRQTILECLSQAEALGLKLDRLYIDADLIPRPAEGRSTRAIIGNGRQLIKTANGLIAALSAQGSAMPIQELSPDSDLITEQSDQLEIDNYQAFCTDAIAQISFISCPPINLLQGDYKPRQSAAARAATVRKVLMVGLVILVVQISYWLIVGANYNTKAQSLRQQSESVYQELFPQDKKIIDLVAQAEGHLAESKTNSSENSFLILLGELGKATKGSGEGARAGILLKSVQYDQKTGQLRAEVVATKISELEKVEKELKKSPNLIAQIDHISENPNTSEEFPANMRLTLKANSKGGAK